MWKLREVKDKVTNVVMNYTDSEAKVREATNDEAWGPSGTLMQEIAQCTFTYEQFPEVMQMLWKRMLQDNKKNWRRTYKALRLLDYLLRNGSERVVTSAREHLYDLRTLENYTFIDDLGKDVGINVRQKVKDLIEFIHDDERLRDERKKAKKTKDKYIGMSCEAMSYRYNDRFDMEPRRHEYDDWDTGHDKPGRYYGFGRRKSAEEVGVEPRTYDEYDRYHSDHDGRKEFRDNDSVHSEGDHKKGPVLTIKMKSPSPAPTSEASNGSKKNTSVSAIQMQKPHQDLLGDLVDLENSSNKAVAASSTVGVDGAVFNPRGDVKSTGNANGNFGDFSSFQSSPVAPAIQSSSQEEFADFASFNSSGAVANSHGYQSLPSSALSPSSSLMPPPLTHPTASPLGAPSASTVSPSNAALLMSLNMSPSLQISTVPGASYPLQPPAAMPYASVTDFSNISLQPSSMQHVMQKQSPNLLTPVSASGIPMQPDLKKQNTWSNSGAIDISVDNLLYSTRNEKPQALSMNEMAVQNLTTGMQQMSFQPMSSPVSAGRMPLTVPAPVPMTMPMMMPGAMFSPTAMTPPRPGPVYSTGNFAQFGK